MTGERSQYLFERNLDNYSIFTPLYQHRCYPLFFTSLENLDDILFRAILAVLLAAFILHRGYYIRQARRSAGAVIEQPPLGIHNRLDGLLAVPAFLSTLVYLLFAAWMAWSAPPFSDWVRWLGVGLPRL